jgi:predicted short-subunit dehydrogenase-like oxidoreductase (DUF2520 family)
MLKVVCIGAGRLAHQLMPALEEAGCHIIQVYNRTPEAAKSLSDKLNASSFISNIQEMARDADIYFFTVSDDAIKPLAGLAHEFIPAEAISVHCSGSLGLEVLPFKRKAGFWPLQSFSVNHEVSWQWIPVIITAEQDSTWLVLDEIAGKMSSSVFRMTDEQKSTLHVAAVFANNFSNHMLTLASSICSQHQLPFEILKPLILETFSKAILAGPGESQTGPAIRGDQKTIDKHLLLLKDDPGLQEVYRLITASIVKTHG